MIELPTVIQRALCAVYEYSGEAFLCIETIGESENIRAAIRLPRLSAKRFMMDPLFDPVNGEIALEGYGNTPEAALAALAEVLAGIEAGKPAPVDMASAGALPPPRHR